MPRRKLSPQDLQEIRQLAARWGQIVARHAFGATGPGTDVDLDAMEQVASAATAGLTEGTLATLMEQQARELGAEQPCPDCGRLCAIRRAERPLNVRAGPLTQSEPIGHCPDCRRDFFPQRPLLRTDGHGYSPAVLRIIVEAAGRLPSFADAAFALHLAGVAISPRHVGRIAHEIGGEMAQKRDDKAVAHRRRQLPARVAAAPEVAAVEVDGGRLRTREVNCGPGVHQPQSKEDKVACLVSLHSQRHEQDPQPQPPPTFTEPRRVQRLVRRMKGLPGEHPAEDPDEASGPEGAASGEEGVPALAGAEKKAPPVREAPRRLVGTCVASLYDSRSFGPLVAAEAQERAFYQAQRRAFVGDGQAYNWSIHKGNFPDFEPIVDLLHVLCYLYLAAWAAGGEEARRWSLYLAWLGACWQGRVSEVIAELRVWQGRVGEPPPGEELKEHDPRRLVAEALSYLGNNQGRMDYPRYRREGLPITSSLVESLVGEFNARVKGPQKFWNRAEGAGAESILQVRAAVLSEDERLVPHLSNGIA